MGGVATRASLIDATSRAEVDAALASGDVVAIARGRYALASADEALLAAHRLSGVVSHFSAALRHGWQVRIAPELPHVTVAKGRSPNEEQRRGVELHRTDLGPDDVVGAVTSPDRTLVDCLRSGSFADGLCVADSALRDGFTHARLRALARDLRGPGSVQARGVAAAADGRAANAFESALRAVARGVDGLAVVPQVSLRGPGFLGRPDLVDERLGIILEADSFEWHGDRAGLVRDARRYNRFAINGWLVLRFTWEDVILHPHEVDLILRAAVAERTERRCRCGGVA
jgi:hypothetical protein